jgi:phosphatidylglycerol lysyltransferase
MALLLFAAALFILHSHAKAYRPSEVHRALLTLQAWQPFAAIGLAAASYLLLTLYDVLALRHKGEPCRIVSSRSPPSPDMPSATR